VRVIVRFHRIATSCVRVASMCVRVPRGCVRPPIARRRLAVFIARPAPRVGGRARVVAVGETGGARAGSAAGVSWTSRTAKAGWAARRDHTSVIDAAGAIYVIGGFSSNRTTFYFLNDVYASTDGGARPDSVGGWVGGALERVLEWVLRGY
jgi:hypothetical protein